MAAFFLFIILLAVVAVVSSAPQTPASKREQLTRVVCGDLSPEECRSKAGACHPGRYMMRVKDSTALWYCALKNDIHIRVTDDPVEAINDLLSISGVTPTVSKAIRNCFYAHLGLLRQGVVDVGAVKKMLLSNAHEVIQVPSQRAAILRAVDTCPLPNGDSMMNFAVCLARTCVSILTNV